MLAKLFFPKQPVSHSVSLFLNLSKRCFGILVEGYIWKHALCGIVFVHHVFDYLTAVNGYHVHI